MRNLKYMWINHITRYRGSKVCICSIYEKIYHFDTSDPRKPQGYISHIALTTGRYLDIALWLGRYHDIALTTTAFDAEAATKHQFTLIIYIEMLKVLHCGFELELLKVLHCAFELNMLI